MCLFCFMEYKISASVTGQCIHLVKQHNLEPCQKLMGFFLPNVLVVVPSLLLFAGGSDLSSHAGVWAFGIIAVLTADG